MTIMSMHEDSPQIVQKSASFISNM